MTSLSGPSTKRSTISRLCHSAPPLSSPWTRVRLPLKAVKSLGFHSSSVVVGSLTAIRRPTLSSHSITRKLLRSVASSLPKSTSIREESGSSLTALKS